MRRHISLHRAAKIMEVDDATLKKWVAEKGFPAIIINTLGTYRQWRIPVKKMVQWIDEEGIWGNESPEEILRIITDRTEEQPPQPDL